MKLEGEEKLNPMRQEIPLRTTSQQHHSPRSRRLPSGLLLVVVLSTAIGGGCRSKASFLPRAQQDPIVLEVENRYWADMTISVRRGATVTRLGLVTTNGKRSFTIPGVVGAAGTSVVFMADPVGSDRPYESPVVPLARGDRYLWTLAVSLEHSTLVRR
ncbi:MAG: hypothetical protein R6T96_03505 [Longimicrobiales bacterium]